MPDERLKPREAAALLREARQWVTEGLLTLEQLEHLERRYRPVAAEAPRPLDAGGRAGLAQKVLLGLGVFILGVAVLFTVGVFWDTLSDAAQVMLLLAGAGILGGTGWLLRGRRATQALGHGLLAVAAVLVPIAVVMTHDADLKETLGRALAPLALAVPAGLLVLGHRHSGPLAFVAYLASLGGLAVMLSLWDRLDDTKSFVVVSNTVLTVATTAFLALHVKERPSRLRWYEWGLAANALLWILPLLESLRYIVPDRAYESEPAILVLALLAALFIGIGFGLASAPSAIVGTLLAAGDTLWLGGEFGDTLGVVVVLFLLAGLLIAAAQTVGWASIRSRFSRGHPEEADPASGP